MPAVFTGNGYREVVSPNARVGDFSELPMIDLRYASSPNLHDRLEIAEQLRDACTRIGFFYIKNTTMPDEIRKGAFAAVCNPIFFAVTLPSSPHDFEAKKYFELPLETKMENHINKNPAFFGYTGMYDENPDATKKGDLHECFDINYQASADYLGHPKEKVQEMLESGEIWPSAWPGGIAEDDFRKPLEAYQREILRIGRTLVRLFALALNMPENFFDDKFAVPGLMLRVLVYPPQDQKPKEDHVGIGAHTDYDVLTILAQDEHNALQVLNRNGEWIQAPPIPGTFVVNICDLMARWTNDVFVSTVHRVINENKTDRYSIPCFFGVNYKTIVEALPTCCSEENPPKWPAVQAGEYILQRLRESYPNREMTWSQNGAIKIAPAIQEAGILVA